MFHKSESTGVHRTHGFSSTLVLSFFAFLLWGCDRNRSTNEASNGLTPERSEQIASKLKVPASPLEPDRIAVTHPASPDSEGQSAGSGQLDVVDATTPTPDQLREAVLQSLGENQDDLAFELMRQMMRVSPDQPESVFLKALVLSDRHRFHEAIKILDDLSVRAPSTRLPVLGQTAEWFVLAGRYDEAESRYRAILDEVPDSLQVHRYLGQLLLQTGRRTEAASHFKYLLLAGALNQEELRCLLMLSKPLPQDAKSSRLEPLSPLARARTEMALGRRAEAIEVLESEGEMDEASASLMARLDAAEDDFESARRWASSHEPDSNDSDGWIAMGRLAANEQDHSKAIRCFSKSLLIDPTDAESYERFSESLRAVGDLATAEEASRRAKLIRETQEIGSKLAIDQNQDRPRIAKLMLLLQQLNRPLEVLGWESVDLVFAVNESAMSEREAEAAFQAIGQKREQLVQSGQHQTPTAFILCGLDVNRYQSEEPGP
jgi:tetratricopeptide (TPR) repeat protein